MTQKRRRIEREIISLPTKSPCFGFKFQPSVVRPQRRIALFWLKPTQGCEGSDLRIVSKDRAFESRGGGVQEVHFDEGERGWEVHLWEKTSSPTDEVKRRRTERDTRDTRLTYRRGTPGPSSLTKCTSCPLSGYLSPCGASSPTEEKTVGAEAPQGERDPRRAE